MSKKLTVSDFNSSSLIFIVASVSVFLYFNIGDDFVSGGFLIGVFIIIFCGGR